MKILIAEDNDHKFNDIVNYLQNLEEPDITRKEAINETLMELYNADKEDTTYDLLILDMQMPRFTDARHNIETNAGEQILCEMKRRGDSTPVIICSSDVHESNDKFKNVVGAIHYNPSVFLQDQFADCIKHS